MATWIEYTDNENKKMYVNLDMSVEIVLGKHAVKGLGYEITVYTSKFGEDSNFVEIYSEANPDAYQQVIDYLEHQAK